MGEDRGPIPVHPTKRYTKMMYGMKMLLVIAGVLKFAAASGQKWSSYHYPFKLMDDQLKEARQKLHVILQRGNIITLKSPDGQETQQVLAVGPPPSLDPEAVVGIR